MRATSIMSFWNHYQGFTDAAVALFNTTPGRVGPELPRCPEDIHQLWRDWTTRGWFEWETEGYPVAVEPAKRAVVVGLPSSAEPQARAAISRSEVALFIRA